MSSRLRAVGSGGSNGGQADRPHPCALPTSAALVRSLDAGKGDERQQRRPRGAGRQQGRVSSEQQRSQPSGNSGGSTCSSQGAKLKRRGRSRPADGSSCRRWALPSKRH